MLHFPLNFGIKTIFFIFGFNKGAYFICRFYQFSTLNLRVIVVIPHRPKKKLVLVITWFLGLLRINYPRKI